MNRAGLVGVIIVVALMVPLLEVHASIPAFYTNENFWDSTHDMPVSFTVDVQGNVGGFTQTGKRFTQTNVQNSASVRLQRFSIDEAFFYISDKGIIKASSDVEALSIYLGSR
jgi:hypothetical protein